MGKFSVQDISALLVEKNGLPQSEAIQFVNLFFDIIKDRLESDKQVKVKGLGTFKVVVVSPRESINVNTGERVLIDSHSKISFTPDTSMKENVNKPFSQFATVVLNDGVSFDDINESKDLSSGDNDSENDSDNDLNDSNELENSNENSVSSQHNNSIESLVKTISEELEEQRDLSDEKAVDTDSAQIDVPVAAENNKSQDINDVQESEEQNDSDMTQDEDTFQEQSSVQEVTNVSQEKSDVAEEKVCQDDYESQDKKLTPEKKIIQEPKITQEDNNSQENKQDEQDYEIDDDNNRGNGTKIIKWVLVAVSSLIVICGAAALGYYVGMNNAYNELHLKMYEIEKKAQKQHILDSLNIENMVNKLSAIQNDSVPQQDDNDISKIDNNKSETSGDKITKTPDVQKVIADPIDDNSKYEAMDIRVKTGAYRIVGTQSETIVKTGETMSKLSNRTLGDGMSCYIEVYNGIKKGASLKPGQKIKIPQLKLKKSNSNRNKTQI